MVGLSKATVDLLYDIDAEKEGRVAFMAHMHDYLYSLMNPGEIRSQGSVVLEQLTEHINTLSNVAELNLFQWCCEVFTQATAFAFYGPNHIFAENPNLVDDFWTWERGLIGVMASPFPQLTSRKSYLACERMVAALTDYLKQERHGKASAVIKERIRWHTERNMSLDDKARCEVVMLFGALTNGGVTLFWMLNYIFSNVQLLKELRQEIEKTSFSADETSNTATVTYRALQTSCPLLNSVFKETLRLIAPMASTRLVTKDTLIADTYLLRANSIAMIAGGVMHEDPAIWGPDALAFNPRRFITSTHGTKTGVEEKQKSTVHPATWRGFGGGAVFCPGRHFAQIEILTLVAALVMGWDFTPAQGKRRVEYDPPKDEKRIPIGVMKPLRDIALSMNRREGMNNLKWVLKME
jgi:cytochrome P450